MWPILAEYHFLPVHCYIYFGKKLNALIKWYNNAMVRNSRTPVLDNEKQKKKQQMQ